MRFHTPCDAPRAADGAFALSTVPPSRVNVARTRPGGTPRSDSVTSQVPTSAYAALGLVSFFAVGAATAPAASVARATSMTAARVDLLRVIVTPPYVRLDETRPARRG